MHVISRVPELRIRSHECRNYSCERTDTHTGKVWQGHMELGCPARIAGVGPRDVGNVAQDTPGGKRGCAIQIKLSTWRSQTVYFMPLLGFETLSLT